MPVSLNALFEERWKKIAWVAGAIIAMGGVAKVWTDYDLWYPASVQHVRERIADRISPISPILRDLQLELAEGKLASVNDLLLKWQRELATTTGAKELIAQHIHQLEDQRSQLQLQIKTLREIKDKR